MRLQPFFTRHPVFTRDEIGAFLASHGERSPRTTDSLLDYHVRSGHLVRIRRGLYAVQPSGRDSSVEAHLVAGRLVSDGVLSYHTALEFHGRAYSVHQQSLVCTRHRVRPFTFGGHRYKTLAFPKALRDQGKEHFAVDVAERAGLDVRVASLERTLVDVLDRPDLGGGWEELWRSLETIEYFDLDVVVEYALLLGNSTTIAKVGLFLESHREGLMVDDSVLETLRKRRPRGPHYLDRATRGDSRLVPGWNLVAPEALLSRSWEEVA